MTQAISSVNHKKYAPQFGVSENVSRDISMTSLELVEFLNKHREHMATEAGLPFPCGLYTRLVHHNLMTKIPKVLGRELAPTFLGSNNYENGKGGIQTRDIYILPKREACLVAMSYSYELQAAVFDHMTALEEAFRSEPSAVIPQSLSAALRLAADQAEIIEQQHAALVIAAPKAEFVDRYVESTGLKGFRQTAKLLGANESRFREFLIDKKIMYRMGGEWQAYQGHIDAGRFEVRTGASDTGHAFNQSKFTPKGVNWVAGLWAQHNLKGVE